MIFFSNFQPLKAKTIQAAVVVLLLLLLLLLILLHARDQHPDEILREPVGRGQAFRVPGRVVARRPVKEPRSAQQE